jgi:GNAT acetyltransferase-like protein
VSAVQRSTTCPPGWAESVKSPRQTSAFADAMRTMGYQPVYLWDGARAGLGLLRGDVPGLRRLTARANVLVDRSDPDFVAGVLKTLAAAGIAHVKVGDTTWGLDWTSLPAAWPFPRTKTIQRHTFVLDLAADDKALLKGMDGAERKIRKAEREGIEVREVRTAEDLAAYCALSRETGDRVRARTAFTDYPASFFEAIHKTLVPAGLARFYLGWCGDQPLAGCLFLCSQDTMLYYLGGSSRDRALTAKQAPAAVFWRAIRDARGLGMSRFDFGGCTPTEDESDPRYGVYNFKKRWGGRLETFLNLEVVLAPAAHYVQEKVLSPLWDRMHPLYFRLMSLRQRA